MDDDEEKAWWLGWSVANECDGITPMMFIRLSITSLKTRSENTSQKVIKEGNKPIALIYKRMDCG